MRTLEWFVDDGDGPLPIALEEDAPRYGLPYSQHYRSADSVVVVNRARADGYRMQQEAFVHSALDALLIRLRVEGDEPPAAFEVAWRPSPTSRTVPDLPLAAGNAGSVVTARLDDRVITLKPYDHAAATRDRLRQWAEHGSVSDLLATEMPAIWVGLQAFPEPAQMAMERPGNPGEVAAITTDTVESRLRIVPEAVADGWEAWLVIAFAESGEELEDTLRTAANRREFLLEGVDRYWRTRLDRAQLPGEPGSPEFEIARRALLTILMLQDRSTGAILRSPSEPSLLGMDRPQDSVWAGVALAKAGFETEAQRHARFLAAAMRDGRRRLHDGSFAGAYHADGAEALPSLILDADDSAWFVWAIGEMADVLPNEDGFRESMWRPVSRAADFVHDWWDPLRRRPLASFDPAFLRDRARPEQLLTAFMAMDRGILIADALDERRASWVSRRAELRALIDYHLVDETGAWRLPDPVPYWPTGAFPLPHGVWDDSLQQAATGQEPLPAYEAARALHFRVRAAIARGEPVPADLRDSLLQIPPPYLDSLTAAHLFLASHEAHRSP